MNKVVAMACSLLLVSTVAATTPSLARDYEPGRADALAAACRDRAPGDPSAFSVGTCLALERENSHNELTTFCAWLNQEGYLEELGVSSVAECVDLLVEQESG